MRKIIQLLVGSGAGLLCLATPTHASTAYGSLSNFDAVNDTGVKCYGFEIEIDDIISTGVGYTYNYNHYGAPKIYVDNTDPAKPVTHIRYESQKDANGNFLAFTNVPNGVFPPTQGHQCTNPAVNEGCEHFGVSYMGSPTTVVRYHWLIEDTAHPGALVNGAPVLVNTPVWNYVPPAVINNVPAPAQVVAVIPAPVVPIPPAKQFGEPSWVKVIKTTTHNAKAVALEELIGGDKDGDGKADWANQEPAEVETEWHLLQTNSANKQAKLNLAGAAEKLPNGNETVTRRYEFYKYSGSDVTIDAEQGEAMCDAVAADGLHGTQASVAVTNADGTSHQADCTQETIVGDYTGANMVGFDAAADLGLIDAIENGTLNTPYVDRTLVQGGDTPYTTVVTTGALPAGITINPATGVLSGTPTEAGIFTFTVDATDSANKPATVSKTYSILVDDPANPIINPVILSNNLPDGIESAVYYTTLSAIAGTPPYSWSADALPAGLTLDASGILSGTPDVGSASVSDLVFNVTDANGNASTKTLSLTILQLPAITTAVLTNGVQARPYSATLTADKGVAPYSWSVDTLPAGLTLNAVTGVVSGTPSAAGSTSPNFTVTDAKGVSATVALPLNILQPPAITTKSLISGTETVAYSATLAASGGKAPYAWSVDKLPAGLALSAGGVISGTPGVGTVGTTNPNFTVTDANGVTTKVALALTIAVRPAACSGTDAIVTSVGAGFIAANNTVKVGYAASTAMSYTGGTTKLLTSELVSYTGTLDAQGACQATAITVKPANATLCAKPTGATSFTTSGKQKITAVTSTTITVGTTVVKSGCAAVTWNRTTNPFITTSDSAEVTSGFKVTGTNTALKITLN